MLLKSTNIEEQLEHLRSKENEEDLIIEAVQRILSRQTKWEDAIEKKLKANNFVATNAFKFELLETNKIYHINQIKKICIDYRLRFLDSKYFKGKIPQKAYNKIKNLEEDHGLSIKGFKIIAPSKLFKLEDKDDPLLFAPIGNGYFYLIHKWGTDLHPMRKLLVLPFKNIINLALLVFLISGFCTMLIPEGLFSKSSGGSEKMIIFFFMFKCVASVVIFYGFALGKNFNPAIWNNKYLKA